MTKYRFNLILRYILKRLSIQKYKMQRTLSFIPKWLRPIYNAILNLRHMTWADILSIAIVISCGTTFGSSLAMVSFHKMHPNRGYEIETPGSIFYENPWSNVFSISITICVILIAIGIFYIAFNFIRDNVIGFIEKQKADLDYFEEYGNLKPSEVAIEEEVDPDDDQLINYVKKKKNG